MEDAPKKESPAAGSPIGCLAQLVWSMLGPGLMFIASALLLVEHRPIGSAGDWFLLVAATVCIAARLLDREPSPEPKPGEAGKPGIGKYAMWVAGGGVALFLVAHFVAPRLF